MASNSSGLSSYRGGLFSTAGNNAGRDGLRGGRGGSNRGGSRSSAPAQNPFTYQPAP